MIVCISANPALDRRVHVDTFTSGEVNRAESSEILPGGKAAHVAMAARALGIRTIWLAFLGGAIGEECAQGLRRLDIEVVPLRTAVSTRVNLEVVEQSGKITELLEPGGTPTRKEREEMLRVCADGLRGEWKQALVVISGSLPAGVPPDFYRLLIERVHDAGCEVFLDTVGDALHGSLSAFPDFVKPNRKEAEVLLGRPVGTMDDAQDAASDLVARGARSAAITLGSDGLVWQESKHGPVWVAGPPTLKAISPVGCGDTTLAGFAYAWLHGWSGEQAVRFAAACGAANCIAPLTARITSKNVESLAPQIRVDRFMPRLETRAGE
jgi:1-phosphofructokinase